MNIYTCTMNLAIDLFIETEEMIVKKVNRTNNSDVQANGKGVNVSMILKKLDIDTKAIGFAGGFTGRFIEEKLDEYHMDHEFIHVDGITRINVFTKVNKTNEEFKLVNSGPFVGEDKQKELLDLISSFEKGDLLIVSGSLPNGVKSEILLEISKICFEKGINFILDVSDTIVMKCLKYKPFLLKPNDEEIAEWFGLDSINKEDYKKYMKSLIDQGAQRVLLSLGEDGAMFADEKFNLLSCNAPKGEPINTTCAGDTLLATFTASCINKESIEDCLSKGVAAASSTAFRVGLTDFSDVEELRREINVIKEEY